MHGAVAVPVLALVRDLIFATKIKSTADAVGGAVKIIRTPALLQIEMGRRLVVDLNLEGAIDASAAWQRAGDAREVIGFVSHVDAQTAARARAGGIERVMARSRFVEILPELLRQPPNP